MKETEKNKTKHKKRKSRPNLLSIMITNFYKFCLSAIHYICDANFSVCHVCIGQKNSD